TSADWLASCTVTVAAYSSSLFTAVSMNTSVWATKKPNRAGSPGWPGAARLGSMLNTGTSSTASPKVCGSLMWTTATPRTLLGGHRLTKLATAAKFASEQVSTAVGFPRNPGGRWNAKSFGSAGKEGTIPFGHD